MAKTPRNVAKQLNMNEKLAPSTPNIKEMFGDSMASESDVVKELFASKDIKSRTEVSDREISIISRLYFLANFIDNDAISEMLQNFLTLKISRKRKSREEFIKALANMPRNEFQIPGMKP